MSSVAKGCCSAGPGYPSPEEAFRNGPRERVLFVTCPNVDSGKADLIVSVDVDPASDTYCKLLSVVELPNSGDEVHHTGWNTCSSCHGDVRKERSHLVVPCLASSRVYTIDVRNPHVLKLDRVLDSTELTANGLSMPHTAHCLADGRLMLSTLGDEKGEAKGDFMLLDGETLAIQSKWPADGSTTTFGYDFWYQPRQNLMLSTEWGVPNKIRGGFNPAHVADGAYGSSVHVWEWETRQLLQSISLPAPEGQIPLEVRFLHSPTKAHAFVGTALGSAVFHMWRESGEREMRHRLAASIPPKKVSGWTLEWMPALITDILVSMDDRFLYVSCWLHGDIRQYDISDPHNVRLVGQCFTGGSIHADYGVKVLEDCELQSQPSPVVVKGCRVQGGPQMLQLSLDGRRLYVTNSLYSVWDFQFYPALAKEGSTMLQLDVDTEKGGLSLNGQFRVDFGRSPELPNGPYLAHEMRYPGGDCTSDIWI